MMTVSAFILEAGLAFCLGLPHANISFCSKEDQWHRYRLTNALSQSWIHSIKILHTDFQMRNLDSWYVWSSTGFLESKSYGAFI